MRNFWLAAAAAAAVVGMLAAGCSGGSGDGDEEEPPDSTAGGPGQTTPRSPSDNSATPSDLLLDTNGDGKVIIGVATPGSRNDGGYYQALVDAVRKLAGSKPNFGIPIIVDEIKSTDAKTELINLAEQGVDMIAVGSTDIAEPLAEVIDQYPDIFWYCNCGSEYPQLEGLAQAQDDSSQISYSAGFATGILMRDGGGDSAYFLGCCDLNFEKEAREAFEMGLKAVDESFTLTYVPTGVTPFDFGNISGAAEAFNNAVAAGADAVYPYLSGAHEAVVKLANDNDVIVMSAGRSDVCERLDLNYQIAVQYDAGDYIETLLEMFADGEFAEGDIFIFNVGEFPFVGAKFCDPTPAQAAELEAEMERIAAGEYSIPFLCIKARAYAFSDERCDSDSRSDSE